MKEDKEGKEKSKVSKELLDLLRELIEGIIDDEDKKEDE